MDIRCVNCGLEFAYDPPPFTPQSEARCPRCGHGNVVGDDDGPAPAMDMDEPAAAMGGSGEEVFCFNCGKPMQARADELIPVCDQCKAGASTDAVVSSDRPESVDDGPLPTAAEAELMVRKSNGQVYGPFPEETIIEWIKAGKIQRDEEVSKIGGAWRSFAIQSEFSAYFPEVKATSRPESQDVQFKKVSKTKESLSGLVRVVIAVGFIVVVGIGVYYLTSRGTLKLPDWVLGKATDAIAGDPEDGGEKPEQERIAELMVELHEAHPEVTGSTFEHYYRARTLVNRGNPEDMRAAKEEMEKAVVADSTNAAALAGLGELYNKISTFDRASGELQRRSFYYIDESLEMGEYQLEAWRAKAWFLFVNGEFDDAMQFCEQALTVNDRDAETHMLMGLCEFGRSNSMTGAAAQHFDKAIEIAPTYDEVHFQKGRCFEQLGQHGAAIDEYTKKIQSAPAFIGSHYALGQIYESLGIYDKAVASYEQVLQLDRLHKESILRLGRIHTQVTGDRKRAATLYLRLAEEEAPALSTFEKLEYALGRSSALRVVGDVAGACAAADEALDIDDTSNAAHFEKGLCLHAQGDNSNAIRSLGQAVNHTTQPGEIAQLEFYLGMVHMAEGNGPDSLESFQRCTENDPTFLPAAVFRSAVYASLEQPEQIQATLWSTKAVEPTAYRRQGKLQTIWAPVPEMGDTCKQISDALADVTFNPELFGLAGGACFHAGEQRRASSLLSRCLSDDPRNWAGQLYSGLLAWEQGDMAKAKRFLSEAADEHRDVGAFHLVLGDLLLAQGDLEGAQREYTDALRYDRDLAWAHNQLGVLHARADRDSEALTEFDAALELDATLLQPLENKFEYNL
jgi:tetratricopeptide (TPR) repeat protein